jgi:hypothetical protein
VFFILLAIEGVEGTEEPDALWISSTRPMRFGSILLSGESWDICVEA